MAKKKYHASHYMHNDESAIANMPQEPHMAMYPQGAFMDQDYGDTLEDIDKKQHMRKDKMMRDYHPRR